MNLLGMLLKAMTAKAALQQIAKKTGLSEKQIKRLIMIATPLLIKFMTQNASSGDGASSLLGALMQHTSKKEMEQQLKEADESDGKKILGHIFGKKEPEVTQSLSAQSGLTAEQVNQILAIMAPAILTGVSEAASNTTAVQGSASPSISLGSAPGTAPGIFSALLGSSPSTAATKEEEDSAINGMALLQALLGARR